MYNFVARYNMFTSTSLSSDTTTKKGYFTAQLSNNLNGRENFSPRLREKILLGGYGLYVKLFFYAQEEVLE